MSLLLGTLDGLFRVPNLEFEHIERVLDGPSSAYSPAAANRLFARADGDLYYSDDDGVSWTVLDTPSGRVTAIQTNSDGQPLYVGTYPPAQLHISGDLGASWRTIESFPAVPPVKKYSPDTERSEEIMEDGGVIHDLRIPPSVPDRIVAGIEPQGVVVSNDGGETWTFRRYGIHGDVHDIEVLGPSEYIAATGQGLYHTGDAGRSWARLDTTQTYFEYTYFHGVLVQNGSVYTSAATGSPGNWRGEFGANAVLLESHDLGETFDHASYPGGPQEIVIGWASDDGRVIAGTMAQDWDDDGTTEARVLERTDTGTWQTAGSVPAGVVTITPT